jgi:hypothetical protein
LPGILAELRAKADLLGMTDSAWAALAGVRKETLSRLKARKSCDFATLEALATAVGVSVGVQAPAPREVTANGRIPTHYDRDYEAQLLAICAARPLEPQRWRALGPAFFMAGVCVTVASLREFDRRAWLALAEELHPGSSTLSVYSMWLRETPVRPSRFVPMLLAAQRLAS